MMRCGFVCLVPFLVAVQTALQGYIMHDNLEIDS